MSSSTKITSLLQLYELLPEHERLMVDVLRQIVKENLPSYCKEKISYNVPYFFGKKGICLIWPATIPRGGIKTEFYLVSGTATGSGMLTAISRTAPISRFFIRYFNLWNKLSLKQS